MLGITKDSLDLPYQIRGIVLSATGMGATFVKYNFDTNSLYLIVPKSSELYNSKRGLSGIKKALEIATDVKKLLIKLTD